MTAIALTAEQAAQVRAGVREFVIVGELDNDADPFGTVYWAPKQWADANGQRAELRGPVTESIYSTAEQPVYSGTIPVAHAINVEVLPVIYMHTGNFDRWRRCVMVEADEFTRAWIVGPDPAERIQLDRDPVPGRDYVVVLTDVELA